jgi:hypothetical protein
LKVPGAACDAGCTGAGGRGGDRDVANVIARFTGGILGTLAFSVSILTGLWARNPVNLILSRAVWALCVFSVIGLLVGGAAQRVVNDYARRRREELVSDGAAHRQEPVSADPMNPAGTPEETPAG